MKIFYLFILLSILSTNNLKAQSVDVVYEERKNIEGQLKSISDPRIREQVSSQISSTATFLLHYQDGESIYAKNQMQETQVDEMETKAGQQQFQKITLGSRGALYKNHLTNQYIREASILNRPFLITDQLSPIAWEFIDEEKIIGQQSVKKATCIVDGIEVTAWYAPDLPLSDGPADYYGLPGLILEVVTPNTSYHALEVSKSSPKRTISKPSKGEKISREEYKKTLDKKTKEFKQGQNNENVMNLN